MSLKLVLKEDMEYQSNQDITEIVVEDNVARAFAKSVTVCRDPLTQSVTEMLTDDTYKLEIVDGKIQVTELNSIQTA